MTFSTLLRRPSALLPPAMSLAALATVLIHVALHGAGREADEGTAAHLFQLLLVGELPIVAYFAIRWLPRETSAALGVLALQAAAGLTALAPVYFLGL